MKSFTRNQKGSSHLVLLLAVLVLAVVAFAGYRVLHDDTAASTSSAVNTQATAPNTINSVSDVRKASNALDDTAIDGQVNPGKLDTDLNALL